MFVRLEDIFRGTDAFNSNACTVGMLFTRYSSDNSFGTIYILVFSFLKVSIWEEHCDDKGKWDAEPKDVGRVIQPFVGRTRRTSLTRFLVLYQGIATR